MRNVRNEIFSDYRTSPVEKNENGQVSSLSIVLLAYERLLRLTEGNDLVRESKIKSQLLACGVVWVLAVIISTPTFVYSDLHSDFTACIATWGTKFGSFYQILLFTSTYGLPGLAIAVIYSIIVRKTNTILSIISNTGPSGPSHSVIARVVACLVLVFWVLHFPFWVCQIWAIFGTAGKTCSNYWKEIAIVLTYVHAVVNPLLYGTNSEVSALFCGVTQEIEVERF